MKTYAVVGLKWWDKVNGNTYFNSIIKDSEGKVYRTGFQYGYGSQYLYEAKNYIENEIGDKNAIVLDMGSYFVKKQEAKNGII